MMKKLIAAALAASCLTLAACGGTPPDSETLSSSGAVSSGGEVPEGTSVIRLSDSNVTVDGEIASTDEAAAVYTAHDIVYYEAGKDFTYGEGGEADEHSAQEAAAHTVVHITRPGTYALEGKLSAGQVAVDLGEDGVEDPEAVVTLILNGVDIACSVAPAIIFYNVYECGSADAETASKDVDTAAAGANVVIADGTVNNVAGSYVARIYKSYTLSEDGKSVADSKKLHKYDGAFYSKMSMNVDGGEKGTGVLNIDAENEGLDAELHLTINGGNINIRSGNDGINTNEDGVSVTTVNGGTLNIDVDGATGEGDGIDSNGWIVINGGAVTSAACGSSQDSGLDADMGIFINGGTVIASGNMYDRIDGGGENFAVFSFQSRQAGGTAFTLKNEAGETVADFAPVNDFSVLVYASPDLTDGSYTLWQGETRLSGVSGGAMGGPGGHGGMGGPRPDGMTPPDGESPPQRPDRPEELGERPENPPEGGERPPRWEDGEVPPQMDGMTPPDEKGPDGWDGRQDDSQRTTEFAITMGGSFFSRIGTFS